MNGNGQKGFAPATRHQAYARVAFAGPAKSGKTFTSLRVGACLGDRIAVIDTERGSASKYVGEPEIPDFDVLELESFSPDAYIAAITLAADEHYPVLIIDSISHAWMGSGGVLEMVDSATARAKSGNAYTSGWREATPMHNKLVEAMLHYPGHLIVTVRTKSRYVLETDRSGKQVPKKVGVEWVQRDGLEYEFDVVGELDNEHTLVVRETRCRALDGKVFAAPGADLAQPIVEWLSIGAPPVPSPSPQKPVVTQSPPPIRDGRPGRAVDPLLCALRETIADPVAEDRLIREVMQIAAPQPYDDKRLRLSMTWAQYDQIKDAIAVVVAKDDADDVPVSDPPDGLASSEAHEPDAALQGEPSNESVATEDAGAHGGGIDDEPPEDPTMYCFCDAFGHRYG